jgi:hypothetical protein
VIFPGFKKCPGSLKLACTFLLSAWKNVTLPPRSTIYYFFLHYGKAEFYRLHWDEKVGVSTASLAKKKHKYLGSNFFLLFSIEGAGVIENLNVKLNLQKKKDFYDFR